MKKLRIVSTFGVLVALLLVVATSAYGGQTKVDVCHITGTHDFGDGQGEVPIGHVINIADPAYDSHIAHGDPEVWNVVTLDDGSEVCTAWIETPDTEKIVFLTSIYFYGEFGGLAGADTECQALADAAGLDGTYKAWLSMQVGDDGDIINAADRLYHADVPYELVDGTVIADNWEALTDGTLDAPINRDEFGNLMDGPYKAYTATNADGTLADSNDCNDWTGYSYAGIGYAWATGPDWSNYYYEYRYCTIEGAHLYCFEQ